MQAIQLQVFSQWAFIMSGMTLADAAAYVTATDPRFALTTANVRGVDYRVFQNAPPHLRALMQASAPAHGDGGR